MKLLRKYRFLAVVFMTVLYLSVTLFSQLFHSHSTNFAANFHSKNNIKSISKAAVNADDSGCIWCHQLLENATELPLVHFDFSFSKLIFTRQFFAYKARFCGVLPSSFYLRGPPENFI